MPEFPNQDFSNLVREVQDLRVDELSVGGIVIPNVVVKLKYGDDLCLRIAFESNQTLTGVAGLDDSDDWFKIGEVKTKLLRTSTSYHGESGIDVEFMLQQSPSAIVQKEIPFSYKIALVNGPKLHFSNYTLDVHDDVYSFQVSENDGVEKSRKRNKYKRMPLLTGVVEIRRLDSKNFDFAELMTAIVRLGRFLNFVRGDTVTFGNCTGFNGLGEEVLFAPGFNRIGTANTHHNWCGIGQISELSQLAKRFFICCSDSKKSEILAQTIEFYRSSSGIRDTSIEMAIVASSAALEVIVPYVLKERGGLDGNMLAERIPFHSKLRACFSIIGLKVDAYEGLSALKSQSASLDNVDAFQLATLYRNRIVHQGKQFRVEGKQLVEMWGFQMWMTEVLLLYIMGHDGTMFDRRPLSGWTGGGAEVPYSI